MQKKHRIILDTNLWISFLLTKQFSFLDELFEKRKVQLIFSKELFDEFLEVIKRPKLSKYFTDRDVEDLIEIIDQYAEFINVTSKVIVCRDQKDDFLLSLSKDSNANFLITGDKDLLILKQYEKTVILNIFDYKQLLVSS